MLSGQQPPENKLKSIGSSIAGGFVKDFHFAKRALLVILIVAAFFYASLAAILYREQEALIFHPDPSFPEGLTLEGYDVQPFEFDWRDGKAYGYHYKKPNTKRVMLFFYGNAMNVQTSISRMIWFSNLFNCSLLVADYPGYGKTAGKPGQDSIDAWLKDYNKTIEEQFNYSPEQRLIWGLSLGGGIAARMAAFHGSHGLILESSFISVSEVSSELYPFLPISLLLRHPFPVLDLLKDDYTNPVFLIHSPDDLIINYSHAQRMHKATNWPLLTISGMHTSGSRPYRKQIAKFIKPKFETWIWPEVKNP